MIDAKNFKVTDILKDGTEVTFRAIRPDDKKRIVEAFKNLEADSIYTRFFSSKRELTDDDLKTATEVDFEKTVALVVTIPAGKGEETIIGAGRYVLYNPPNEQRSAEILSRIPAQRWGTPEDLQGAVVFLCSSASEYVNGYTLAVDGGWLSR